MILTATNGRPIKNFRMAWDETYQTNLCNTEGLPPTISTQHSNIAETGIKTHQKCGKSAEIQQPHFFRTFYLHFGVAVLYLYKFWPYRFSGFNRNPKDYAPRIWQPPRMSANTVTAVCTTAGRACPTEPPPHMGIRTGCGIVNSATVYFRTYILHPVGCYYVTDYLPGMPCATATPALVHTGLR